LKLNRAFQFKEYLLGANIADIIAAGFFFVAAVGIASIGAVNSANILHSWFATDFTTIHISFFGQAFNNMMANLMLALSSTLLCLPLLLISYLVGKAHPAGVKLSILATILLVAVSMLVSIKSEVILVAAAMCLTAGLIQKINTRRTKIATKSPIVTENLAKVGISFAGLFGVVVLFGIVIYIFARGSQHLSWEFVTGNWDWGHVQNVLMGREVGTIGGLSQYILGSLLIVGVCEAVSLPLGVGAATYLSEYSSENKITSTIRFFIETLAGVPSIVFGLLGLFAFVNLLAFKESVLAGGLSLAFMILPWNIRVTEEAMKAVPHSYREASYALGATKWQTIKNHVWYAASPGIITGILLGVGAAIGETAVLIYTTGAEDTTHFPTALIGTSAAKTPTLAVWIMNLYTQFSVSNVPLWETQNIALAGASLLMLLFLGISIAALLARNYLSKRITGR
jgi:phosphate transport system permease protein